jgi:hypothetical protein
MTWSKLICGVSFPPTCQRCSRFCHALTCICKMRCRWLFTRRSRACGVARAGVDNECREAPGENRRVYGFGLVDWRDGWFDGRVAAGRTAEVFCEQVRAAVARSKQRGRVAIVKASNLKTHTSAGSLLVRSMLDLGSRSTYTWCIRRPMILTPTGTLMALAGLATGRDAYSSPQHF